MSVVKQGPRSTMKLTARQIVETTTTDPKVDQVAGRLVADVYAKVSDQLVEFFKAMGLTVSELPTPDKIVKAEDKSELRLGTWYRACRESSRVSCGVSVSILLTGQEVSAVGYKLIAGEGVPAFTLLKHGDNEWLYQETVQKRFGALGTVDADALARALGKAVQADLKQFREQVVQALKHSRNSVLTLVRVGGYKL